VVSKPPDEWWVKISDFGISKREEETMNATSVIKGTMGFLAPELLGFNPALGRGMIDDKAADMWALGETTVLMLTARPTFEHPGAMFTYCTNQSVFPLQVLRSLNVSSLACDFVQQTMKTYPQDRLEAENGLEHQWIQSQLDEDIPPVKAQYSQ
jgi:serine/threonine protein kinase